MDEEGIYHGSSTKMMYRYRYIPEKANYNLEVKEKWSDWTRDMPHQFNYKNPDMRILKYERREAYDE